jgi:hypothetical protein
LYSDLGGDQEIVLGSGNVMVFSICRNSYIQIIFALLC